MVQSTAKGIARRRRRFVWIREAPQLLPLPGIMVRDDGALVLFLGVFGATAVLGYRESERWIRIRIFCQDVLGYLVFFKLY